MAIFDINPATSYLRVRSLHNGTPNTTVLRRKNPMWQLGLVTQRQIETDVRDD